MDPVAPAVIRALRERLAVTQAQFARALGVTRISVVRWEHGEAIPGAADRLLALLVATPALYHRLAAMDGPRAAIQRAQEPQETIRRRSRPQSRAPRAKPRQRPA